MKGYGKTTVPPPYPDNKVPSCLKITLKIEQTDWDLELNPTIPRLTENFKAGAGHKGSGFVPEEIRVENPDTQDEKFFADYLVWETNIAGKTIRKVREY